MKTRKEYKDYYLDKLTKMFPGLTQADYNSAQEFCYNEEWYLKDTDSVEGLNDAWKEYEKRFDEGFEVINNRQIKSVLEHNEYMIEFIRTYTHKFKSGLDYYYRSKKSPYFDSVKIYYDDGTALSLSDLEKGLCANVSLWKYDTTSWVLEVNTKSFIWINRKDVYLTGDLDTDMELVENTLNELLTESPDAYSEFEESKFEFEKHNHKLNDGSEIMNSLKEKNMIKSSSNLTVGDSFVDYKTFYHNNYLGVNLKRADGSGIRNLKGWDTAYPEAVLILEDTDGELYLLRHMSDNTLKVYPYKEYNRKIDMKYKENPESVYSSRQIKSSKETLYEDDGGRFYTWSELKADIDEFVKTSDFKDQFEGDEDMFEYFEKDHKTPKYYKIYMDFWDISSNGAISEVEGTEEQWNEYNEQHGITSAKENDMKTPIKSAALSQSEREGMEVVLGVICGFYEPDESDKRYQKVKEELTPEELNKLDEICTYVFNDEQNHKTVTDRILKDDIPLLRKVYNIIDNNDLFENDWDAMSGFEKLCLESSHAIKSSNGNWEYQSDDMDEVENKIGDIGISFTEPLLLADDGTIYTRTGFNEWLKYLEKEYADNWYDAYETYHCDSDKEFIEMCSENYFHHDFGHTLSLYKQGLKDIAESIAEEIPSKKPAFAIPSGFAFELYPEEEEPSGFNSYWIDDLQLNSDSFVWGINPSLGNRFDVAIDPDYLWNGKENVTSNRRINMKTEIESSRNMEAVSVAENMPGVQKTYDKGSEILVYLENGTDNNAAEKLLKQIMDTLEDEYDNYGFKGNIENHGGKYYIVLEPELTSTCHGKNKDKKKKSIKSGTSNYWNGNATGYDFPLVIYEAENYVYDEETDTETEERDYDADQWEYEDAIANAETLADKFDVEIGEDTYKPYTVQIKDGYYAGLQIIIDDTEYDGILIAEDDEEYAQLTEDYPNDYVYTREEFGNMCKEYGDKIMAWLKELVTNYGWQAINVVGHFSNGEGLYERSNVFNSRKPVRSGKELNGKQKDDFIKKAMKKQGYSSSEADTMINQSRKPIQSRITQKEIKDMIRTGQAIDITYGDSPDGVRLDVLQISKGTYGMNGALFKGSDGNLYAIGGRTTNLFRYV